MHLFSGLGATPRPLDVDAALSAMDALGIRSLVVADEFWAPGADGEVLPGHRLPGGRFRPSAPGAELAATLHPDRFGVCLRLDPADPELDDVVARFAATAGARALRIDVRTPALVRALADGELLPCVAAAARHGLPLCVLTYGQASRLVPYLSQVPVATLVLDHCGLPGVAPPSSLLAGPGEPPLPPPCTVDELFDLGARHPQLVLKWSHGPRVFAERTYPFTRTLAQLRRAVHAFGAGRVMWGSDVTAVAAGHYTWAQALFCIRHTEVLTEPEKRAVLGGSARRVFGWPVPV